MAVLRWDFHKPRKICSWDPKEIWDVGLQGNEHSNGDKPEGPKWWLFIKSRCHCIQIDYYLTNVFEKYKTRYMFWHEHIDSVYGGASTCSYSCSKTCDEVPKGYIELWPHIYSWLWV